jgi:hypothetical protein
MGQVVLIVLAGLAVLTLVVLVAPVRIRASFAPGTAVMRVRYLIFFSEYDVKTRVRTRGVLGRVISRRGPRPPKPPKPKKPKRERKPPEERPRLRERGQLLWSSRLVLRRAFLVVMRLVGRILRSFRLESADINLTMGLANPAHTGMATGLFHATQPAVRRRFPRLRLSLHPDFQRPIKKAEGEIVYRIIPMEPVAHLLRALGTLPWRGLWKFKKAWSS